MILFCTQKARRGKGGSGWDWSRGRKHAGWHFCPAGNLWNRFIMFAYNCGPSRERERERDMRLQLNEGAERRRGKGGRGVQDRRGALAQASSSSRTFLIKLHFRLGNFLWSYKKAGRAAAEAGRSKQLVVAFVLIFMPLLYHICSSHAPSCAHTPLHAIRVVLRLR